MRTDQVDIRIRIEKSFLLAFFVLIAHLAGADFDSEVTLPK